MNLSVETCFILNFRCFFFQVVGGREVFMFEFAQISKEVSCRFFPWMDIEATELGGPDPENAVGSLDDNTDSSWPFPDVRGGLWDYSPSV